MDIARLSESPVGQLVPILGPDPATREIVEGLAFLPAPLPVEIELSTSTWNTVSAATAALARLDGAARLIPTPRLLRRPALRREAQSTSALEGTYAPFEEVMAADAENRKHMSADLREVLNFEDMAELAFTWPEDRPLTVGMLGELQRTLVRRTAGQLSDAGGIRDRIVIIGPHGSSLTRARFVPPPPDDQLRAGVEDLLGWVNHPPDIPTVVQAALTHYQFESLHPFSDGNGRLGRLLVIVQLMRGALIREPLLVVSPWFEQRRSTYQDALLEVSCSGNWDAWVAFFTEGVAASARESQRKVERLVSLQETLRRRVQDAGKRGKAEQLAADLVGMPFITMPDVAAAYRLSQQGAINAVRALESIGILERAQLSTPTGAQLYVARDVYDVISE
jgi:Fic family protein